MNILGLVVIIGLNVLSYLLNRPQSRQPTRKEKFELPRTEEGEHLPVLFGVGELSPNFTWAGNIRRKIIETEESGPRTLYYANAIGTLCHGPLDTIHDIIFEDLHLSAAPPTTNTRPRGEPRPVGPALSVPLPFELNGGFLDEMVYSLQMFGGIRTVDGQGGLAGRIHIHDGSPDQLPCELIYPWWGQEWTPGWPGIAYIVFGGVPLRCIPGESDLDDLMWPFKWSTDGNPFDGIAAGGGGAAPILNGTSQVFGAVEGSSASGGAGHMCWTPCHEEGQPILADSFGVFVVPPNKGDRPSTFMKVVEGCSGDPALDAEGHCESEERPALAPPGTMVFANTWQTCFGCTQAYNHTAHKIQCLRKGDVVTVRFKWIRNVTYGSRSPNRMQDMVPGSGMGFGGSVSLGSEKTVVRPSYATGWGFVQSFDPGLFPSTGLDGDTIFGTEFADFEHTFPPIPDDHEDLFNNICYLGIGYGANWRTPWSEVWIREIELEVQQAGGAVVIYDFIPEEFTKEGRFYWGLNPRPFPPRVLASCIPKQVSGEGVLSGANLIDCAYETITNKIWGLSRNPLSATKINLTNFQEKAAIVKAEGLGISMVSAGYRPAEQILQDLATAGNAIFYRNRITGEWEVALVRPDYDVSLLPNITTENSDQFTEEIPRGFKLVHQVQVRFRRWKPSQNEEQLTDYQIGEPPYSPGIPYQLPGSILTNVVITQDGDVIDADDYTISNSGVIRFSSRADSIDWDGEPLLLTAVVNKRRPGFEDGLATAYNDAMFQAVGNVPTLTVDMPMLMDDVSAQRCADDLLLTNSRPLRSFRWTMLRDDPTIHPGTVVKATRPELKLDGLPIRVLRVTERADPDGGFEVQGVEEKYGFRSGALIFHPVPDRPPLDFPGDSPTSLGPLPAPAGLAQMTPSNTRIALYPAQEGLAFQLARTRVPSFYVGDPGEFGADGCAADEAPVYINVPAGATYYDDGPLTDDGCPYYYFVRHIGTGYDPSNWVGPIAVVLGDGTVGGGGTEGPTPDEQDEIAPTVALEEFEDYQNEKGYTILWFRDPQHRVRRITYKVRHAGGVWSASVAPPIGPGLNVGDKFSLTEGWKQVYATVDLPADDHEIEVQWSLEYAWHDGTVVDTLTTVFPLYLEPVWDDEGNIVYEGGQIVTASRLDDIDFHPQLVTEAGVTIVNNANVPIVS